MKTYNYVLKNGTNIAIEAAGAEIVNNVTVLKNKRDEVVGIVCTEHVVAWWVER